MGDLQRNRSGFTLIELSIVLVIVGLIVGGVLVGRDLIKAATRRALITEVEQFKLAVNTFQGKYNCIPGDCPNAENFFGTKPDACQNSVYSADARTCNGNGNGIIDSSSWTHTGSQEEYTFWQQLQIAGLLKMNCSANGGMCNGITYDVNNTDSQPGMNVPYSAVVPHGAWDMFYENDDVSGYSFLTPNANVFFFGGSYGSATFYAGPILTPWDAYSIDSKIDDGKPGYGDVFTFKPSSQYSPGCATSDTASVATYNVGSPSQADSVICNLVVNGRF